MYDHIEEDLGILQINLQFLVLILEKMECNLVPLAHPALLIKFQSVVNAIIWHSIQPFDIEQPERLALTRKLLHCLPGLALHKPMKLHV